MNLKINFTKISEEIIVPPYTHPIRPGFIFSAEKQIYIAAGKIEYISTGYMWEPNLTEEILEEMGTSFRIGLRFESLYQNKKFIVIPYTTINFIDPIKIPILNPGRHGSISIEKNEALAVGIIEYLPIVDAEVD